MVLAAAKRTFVLCVSTTVLLLNYGNVRTRKGQEIVREVAQIIIIRCLIFCRRRRRRQTQFSTFHAGRPAGNFGPLVSLFNGALGLFDYHLCHLEDESSTLDPPATLIRLAH